MTNLETKSDEANRNTRFLRRKAKLIITCVVTILAGACAAAFTVRPRTDAAPPQLTQEDRQQNSRPNSPEESPENLLHDATSVVVQLSPEQADVHLLERDYRGALRIYDTLPSDEQTDLILYKQAICHELLDGWEAAHAAYQQVIGTTQDTGLATAATLGTARTRLGGNQLELAKHDLFRMLQVSNGNDELLASIQHLLAFVTSVEAYRRNEDLLSDGIRTPYEVTTPEMLLDLPRLFQTERPTATNEIVLLDRISAVPQDIHVKASAADESMADLIQQIGTTARLRVSWSRGAMTALENLRINLAIADIDVATLLDSILEPNKLTWQPIPRGFTVYLQREVPHKKLVELQKQQAQRIASKTVTLYPDHWLHEQTYLCLGNMAFWDGRFEDASSYFEEVTQRFDNTTVVKAAWFNLAKVYWSANDRKRCRESLYHVVDQTVGSPVESIAYYFLGLIAIGDKDPDEASKFFGRTLSLTKDDRLRAHAAIYMSAAQILADNPHAANRVLVEHRDFLRGQEWHDQAVFLTALSRYRAAASSRERINEGRALIASLATVDPRQFDGTIGYYLVGQALDEIGYSSRAEQIYSQGAAVRMDELRNSMVFRMAEIAFETAQWETSKSHLELLTIGDNETWSRRAKLQSARIDYEQANYDACLSTAVRLLPECKHQSEKVAILDLAGRAFEKKNNYYQAALCFAGMMPSDTFLAEGINESYSPEMTIQR